MKVAIVCRSSVEMAKEMSTKNKWRDAGTGERNGRTKGEREMSGAVGNAQKHRHQNATLLPAAYSSAPRLSVRSACPIRVNQPASLTRNIVSGNICIPAHSTIACHSHSASPMIWVAPLWHCGCGRGLLLILFPLSSSGDC